MLRSRVDEPSVKAKIASLPDQVVMNIVERYAEHLKTRVQRTCKEIANKCFQAVTIVRNRKATGYGRSPLEAATHSIRKLAQGITEDEQGLKFFQESFEKCSNTHDLDITSNTDYKNIDQRDVSKQNYPKLVIQDQKFDLKNKNPFTNKSNQASRSATKFATKKDLDSPKIDDVNENIKPNNLQYLLHESTEEPTAQEQLKKAYAYIQKLQAQLKCFSAENKYLREIIGAKQQTRKGRIQTQIPNLAIELSSKKITLEKDRSNSKFKSVNSNYASIDCTKNRSFAVEDEIQTSFTHEKKKIPKLNLKILPNYHGNSNKSLNQSLLLAYQKLKKK